MFYSQFILAKKGPLGTIWIAAHLERKLRKNQVADTDIGVSVDSILFPEMPIALRLSSHLLLGVVRIYSRKVNYLFDDCSEALLKVKQAFRSTAVDLPPEESTAPYHSITLPETFDLDDFELPDNDLQGNYVDHHISSKDQITLQDTMDGVVYSTSKFGLDERFGDDDASGLDLDEELLVEKAATTEHATGTSNSDFDPQASSDHANDIGIANEDLDDYDGDNEPVDYAQAPCTPGLWEEPNLSNIQDTSACDDHQEPENHTITESAVKDNLENSSTLPHEQHHPNLFEPHEKSLPHIAPTEQIFHNNQFEQHEKSLPHVAAAEQIVHNNQFEPHEKSLPHIAATEQMVHNNQSEPHEKSLPPIAATEQMVHNNQSEPHEKSLPLIAATEQMVHNNQFEPHEKSPPHIAATEQMIHHNQFEPLKKSLPHVAATEQILMNNLGSTSNTESRFAETVVPMSYDPAKVDDLLSKNVRNEEPVVQTANLNHANFVEYQGNQANAFQPTTFLESNTEPFSGKGNIVGIPQVPAFLEPKDSSIPVVSPHYSMASSEFPVLRQCVTPLNNETNVGGPHATSTLNSNSFQEIRRAEIPQSNEVRLDNVIERQVQAENINSYTSDIPAPEKRLSLPHWLSDVPRDFVPESTPLEKDIQTTGNKRTFAESSMSAQSLNLNESSGFLSTNTTAQSLNLNESSGFFTTNMTVQSRNLNESSGFFPTNMTTVQSQNLNESSGFFTTNMTVQNPSLNGSSGFTINMSGQPVMNDDDLLSSILVGRKSSILKMKPTPPVVTPPAKRRRASAPKTGIIPKRKVVMDDNMVLHGDTIRQQLTNTEDIRRLRKKAPCTRSEISMLEKQFLEDEIFSEPIFTGVSTKLASLHAHLHGLRKIVVSHKDVLVEGGKNPKSISQNDEKDMQPEVGQNVPKENGPEGNFDPVVQPTEIPSVTDSHKYDNNTVNLDYNETPAQMPETRDVAEPFRLEHDLFGEGTAMEIDGKSLPDAADNIEVSVMPTEVQPPPPAANMVPSDTFDMSATASCEVQMDASLQTDTPVVHSNDKLDLQSVDIDINSNKPTDSDVPSEVKIDDTSVKEMTEEKHEQEIEFRKNEEVVVNEDAALTSNVESNAQNLVYNGIFGEELATDAAYNTEVNPVLEDASLDQKDNSGHHVTFEMPAMNVEDIPADNRVDGDEFTHSAVENDTDFLNFDDLDDDEADAGGDYGPDVEATRVIDNSGWSSRTKAVAKYLQIMFDKEGERGRNMLAVNNLLVGKTRKEASRMFFETLVLKTKDYIHVEQADPFGNINVFPRSKLLKSDF